MTTGGGGSAPATKQCATCAEEKPLEAFWKATTGRLGRFPHCKTCSGVREPRIVDPEGDFKVCRRCKEVHPLHFFRADRNKSKGRETVCKTCKGVAGYRREDIAAGYKACRRCEKVKPLDAFNPDNKGWRGVKARCKECLNAYAAELRRNATPEQKQAKAAYMAAYTTTDAFRRQLRDNKYGLLPGEYDTMLAAQKGACAICEEPHDPSQRWKVLAVDHDHDCCPGQRACGNCVRGLLCAACNRGLGYFTHNPKHLRAAAGYMAKAMRRSRRPGPRLGRKSRPLAE
ncbi:endonuclease VII domain-containing protein [Kineococcus sp. LSe6-4]|uniref:Endonuclease VII domain-containing protein n=1 Tax=Kineococcus halophytocola TaxID=3234027 RepID=A0ABV4H8G5_9ACTN